MVLNSLENCKFNYNRKNHSCVLLGIEIINKMKLDELNKKYESRYLGLFLGTYFLF